METTISSYDQLENLRFSTYEIVELLENLQASLPNQLKNKVQSLKNRISSVSDKWNQYCEDLIEKADAQRTHTEQLAQQEKVERTKHRAKSQAQQKKLKIKEQAIKSRELEFERSMKQIKELCQKNVEQLEVSIKEKKKKKQLREKERLSKLKDVEAEMSTVLETPLDISKEISKVYYLGNELSAIECRPGDFSTSANISDMNHLMEEINT